MSAVLNRDIEIVQSLLRRADVNPNVKNKVCSIRAVSIQMTMYVKHKSCHSFLDKLV